MTNCIMPNRCPFYCVDDHKHHCNLTHKDMIILTDPNNCRPLIDFQKNNYKK